MQVLDKIIDVVVRNPKEAGFCVLLCSFLFVGVYKSIPVMVDEVFMLTVSQNREPLRKITQERKVSHKKTVWVDHLNLRDGYHLRHPELGDIGYANNYFIDVKGRFEVRKAGKYYFYAGSDDGFRLKVDGKLLCQHVGDRAFPIKNKENRCSVGLKEGEHTFEMEYFQGGGHSGLTLQYQSVDDWKKSKHKYKHWVGDDSKYMRFIRWSE